MTGSATPSAPGIGAYGSHHFAISSSIGATCSRAVSTTGLPPVKSPVLSQFRAIQAHTGASETAEYAPAYKKRSRHETPRRNKIIPATATTSAAPVYLLRQASAESAAAHIKDERSPSSRCLSAQCSASVVSRMNDGSDHAQSNIRMAANPKTTLRQAHTATNRDSARRRSHMPTVNTASANIAAFRGPATAIGSKTPKLKTAYSADVNGGHSGG